MGVEKISFPCSALLIFYSYSCVFLPNRQESQQSEEKSQIIGRDGTRQEFVFFIRDALRFIRTSSSCQPTPVDLSPPTAPSPRWSDVPWSFTIFPGQVASALITRSARINTVRLVASHKKQQRDMNGTDALASAFKVEPLRYKAHMHK